MATYGGQDFTTFRGVNLRGSIALRLAADVIGNESTLSAQPSLDTARAWKLPDKSGILPVAGTIAIQVPAISASSVLSTVVTVAGVRAEDSIQCDFQQTYTVTGTRGLPGIITAVPGNGNITLQIANSSNGTATIYFENVLAYVIAR